MVLDDAAEDLADITANLSIIEPDQDASLGWQSDASASSFVGRLPVAQSTQIGAGLFAQFNMSPVSVQDSADIIDEDNDADDDDLDDMPLAQRMGDDASGEMFGSAAEPTSTPVQPTPLNEEPVAGPSHRSPQRGPASPAVAAAAADISGESRIIHRVEARRWYDKFRTSGTVMTVKIREPPAGTNLLSWLEDAMRELHTLIVTGSEPTDMVGVEFNSHAFTRGPCGISYRPVGDFNFENLFNVISSVAQSSAGFSIDDSFVITSNIVSMPIGAGRVKKARGAQFWAKQAVIRFENKDNLCLPRSIVAGIVFAQRGHVRHGVLQQRWDNVRTQRDRGLQKDLAVELVTDAGIQIPLAGCGMPELQAFQRALAPEGIALVLYDLEKFGSSEPAFFDGTNTVIECVHNVVYTIYLLHDRLERHYGLILNIAQAAGTAFFCIPCGTAYDRITAHRCRQQCAFCKNSPPCEPVAEKIRCEACMRFFRGNACFAHHKAIGSHGPQTRLCDMLQTCKTCLKQVYRKDAGKHVCGIFFCRTCKQQKPENHQCFMAPLKKLKETDKPDLFVFYDFETRQELEIDGTAGMFLHEPNLCVSQQRCTGCIDKKDTEWECGLCEVDKEKVFSENPVARFVDYVLQERSNVGRVICIAHNAKGFDAQFILRYIVEEKHVTPQLITNGTSIMEMKVGSTKFLDSLNYFHMALSKLPKAFGLGENIFKGTFPHLFNRTENQRYVGPLPPLTAYSPDTMSPTDREALVKWHAKTVKAGYVFDFQKEIVAYCRTDVAILRKACAAFRKIFQDRGNVCPFTESITIASACNKVFRRNFLAENKIAVLPQNGYRRSDRQSDVAVEWLLWCELQYGREIAHAGRGREYKLIDGTRVDGYFKALDGVEHVLQFHGCFYHGCDKCYTDPRKRDEDWNGSTLNERFLRTLNISTRIRSLGYTLHEIWECEYRRLKCQNPAIGAHVNEHPVLTNQPLNPRDAFFGGRTGNTRSYCETRVNEKIHYIDVCSLYPYICKYGKFPVGHPTVYTADTCNQLVGPNNDLRNVEGIVKCTVLAPRDLYHPILPVRMHNRLMFALCRTCCEEMRQDACPHNVVERSFEGTWVSCELQKAIEKGYRVLAVHEIWQYEVEQYDRNGQTAGLFGGYINLWLKIKQEASGWPVECTTEDRKIAYLDSFQAAEGIQLDRERIEENPGLRSVAKLCLNSFWGKFGQRENLPKTEVVTTRQRLLELLTDQSCEVTKIINVNEELMYVSWQKTSESAEVNPHVNVVIAAYTTAQARLKLYSYLEPLDKRVLYYDTDSCIYISTDNASEYKPRLGNLLGDMTDELTSYGRGSYIKRFVSGGPKFYGYIVQKADGSEVATCKVKGIGLNYKNAEKINFESIYRLITEPGTNITVKFAAIRRDEYHNVVTRQESKTCKPVLVKRRRWGEFDSLPYGYIE